MDVKEALASVMDVLQDDGLLYVEVPDSSAYFENPVVPFYYFDTEHINHFEPQSLINLGIKNGLRSERTGRRMIDVSAGTKYPAAYSMYRKQQDSRSVVKCNIDSIRKFIAGSVNRMEGMNTLEET
ncbi:MAG TPA: hypothetical protein PKJ42_02550, partial [Candidatus Goldiibacteriota bacterium]|nr:hypothetical protein [Candidatus Goldiibacteriota bacterium]